MFWDEEGVKLVDLFSPVVELDMVIVADGLLTKLFCDSLFSRNVRIPTNSSSVSYGQQCQVGSAR